MQRRRHGTYSRFWLAECTALDGKGRPDSRVCGCSDAGATYDVILE